MARFVPLPAPSDEEVEKVLAAVVRKVARAGPLAGEDDGWTGAEEDAFAALQRRLDPGGRSVRGGRAADPREGCRSLAVAAGAARP